LRHATVCGYTAGVLGRDYADQVCSVARALEVVGERWTLLIVRDLFFGVTRFTDLQTHLDVPRAVLSARLALLVDAGIAERRPYRAGRDEYVLTDAGLELWPVVHGLMQWGERHLVDDGPVRLFAHAVCGTDLTAAGECPACGVQPPPGDVETRPGPGRPSYVRRDPFSRALRRPHRLLEPAYASSLLPVCASRMVRSRSIPFSASTFAAMSSAVRA
jgi:DNA-binding HxlR family transcriptional regulator